MRILQFESMLRVPGLIHGISTRDHNISFSVGDHHGDASKGRRILLGSLRIDPKQTVVAGQIHGNHVAVVNATHAGSGCLVRGTAIPQTDGLYTNVRGVGLLITAADCPPLLLFDPVLGCVAAVHCGWRGTAAGIVHQALDVMQQNGSDIADIHAGLGPGIGVCCYEVGEDVAAAVPGDLRADLLRPAAVMRAAARSDRWHLDLRGWIQAQLLKSGVVPGRLEIMDLCTSCRTDLFFSHRAEKGNTGRFALVAALSVPGTNSADPAPA